MTIISGILMLGVLVFVHELGHFAVAKWCGVKVLKFSIGFGPKLASRIYGDTEYQVCAIPLGGYVQMLGEGSGEQGEDSELTESEKMHSFADQPVAKRLAIVSAGPIMNLVLPLLILPISFMVGIQMPTFLEAPAVIGYVVAGSDGSDSGFVAGDTITMLNNVPIDNWNATNKSFISQAGEPREFTVERNGRSVQLAVGADNDSLQGMQALGLLPQQDARIGGLAPSMPALTAGIEEGDLIVKIGAHQINSWYDLKGAIQKVGANEVAVQVERKKEQLTVMLTPKQQGGEGAYLLGIAPQYESKLKRYGFVAAVGKGAEKTWELIEMTVVFVQKLVTGNVSTKNIGGPITVVQIAGQAAQSDLAAILSVLAFISIQLGILNLLPIPILDGGHILFYLIELLIRRPVPIKVREMSQQVGMAMLLMLMVVAFYNDIVRLWG